MHVCSVTLSRVAIKCADVSILCSAGSGRVVVSQSKRHGFGFCCCCCQLYCHKNIPYVFE